MIAMRKIWIKVHLFLGLLLGSIFLIIALTGSLLVFDHKIDELLNPQLITSEGRGVHKSIDEILDSAKHFQKNTISPIQLRFPRTEKGVYTIYFRPDTGGSLETYIDPYSAEPLGQRLWGAYLMSFIYRLHYTFLMGKLGKQMVGILGVFLIFSALSGIYIWWPKKYKNILKVIRIRRSRGKFLLYYDLHRTIGFFTFIFIIALAISGFSMIFPKYVKSLLSIGQSPKFFSKVTEKKEIISMDRACKIAKTIFEKGVIKRIYLPKKENDAVRIMLRQPQKVTRSYVWIDQYSGQVLGSQAPEDRSIGELAFGWMFPIHSGAAFGLLGRYTVFMTGLATVALCIFGVGSWWEKRKFRQVSKTSFRK